MDLKGAVAFFGGTFNPIHFGHIHLALEIKEFWGLSQVFFSPASVSPLRENEPLVLSKHRLNMVKLAIDQIEGFIVYEKEVESGGKSYTIDAINHFLIASPHLEKRLAFIIGEDAALQFPLWKEYEALALKAVPLIGTRSFEKSLSKIEHISLSLEIKNRFKQGLTPIPLLDISSSKIRERIKKGLYCQHLLPLKVLDYIYENQLYSSTKN